MNPAILDGFKLMFLGMGMVFLFLFAMIFFITATTKLLSFLPEKATPVPGGSTKPATKNLIGNKDLVNVISKAISTYKTDKK